MGNEEILMLEFVGRFEEEEISTLEEGDFIFFSYVILFVVIECWRCFFF